MASQPDNNDVIIPPKVTVVPIKTAVGVNMGVATSGGVVMGVSKLPTWKYFRRESVSDLSSSEYKFYLVAILQDDAECVSCMLRLARRQ